MENVFYYKRNEDDNIKMSRDILNLKVGDVIEFYGKLYDSIDYKNEVANTIIIYTILFITDSGVLIETNNLYKFDKANVQFVGEIFSKSFNIINNKVQPYTVETSVLSFYKGTKKFLDVDGFCRYSITGNGVGENIIYLENTQ